MAGFAPETRAAAPATCGAEADVPQNGFRLATLLLTLANAAMSGLTRPSTAGPCELNCSSGYTAPPLWSISQVPTPGRASTAPTARAYGELAGSVTLPAAALEGFTNDKKLLLASPQ